MKTHAKPLAFLKISSIAATLLLAGCAIGPRDGQFFPGGPGAAIRFNGFLRTANTDVIVSALNPSTGAFSAITTAHSSATSTDCDVAGQCWYQYQVDKVVPRGFWRDAGGNLLRAVISTAALQGIDGTLVTFPIGAPTDQCISDTYNQSGGVQTALACGRTFQATITTCKVAPCSQ